jgi:tetratricopeptide (TPR) repeat protein
VSCAQRLGRLHYGLSVNGFEMPQIVTPQKKMSPAHRSMIVGGVALTVILLIGGGVYWYIQYRNAQETARFERAKSQIASLSTAQKYPEAREVARAYTPTAPDVTKRCYMMMQEGALSTTLKDYPGAKSTLEKVMATEGCPKFEAVRALGLAAARAGNKEEAIKHFKEEIRLFPKDYEMRELYIKELQDRIRKLGGTP